jgi:hypothetical protein
MGYTTEFRGELKFTSELRKSEIRYLANEVLEQDYRDHPEWKLSDGADLDCIDLELTDEWDGFRWSGAEKSRRMVKQVNAVIELMRRIKPDFGLTGELQANGEEMDDRWVLAIEDGKAVRRDVKIEGSVYRCPHCGGEMMTSEAEKIR